MLVLLKSFFDEVVKPFLESKKPYTGELNKPETETTNAVIVLPVVSTLPLPTTEPTVGTTDSYRPVTPPSPALPQDATAIKTNVVSPIISVMNKSTVLTDDEIKTALAALQIQLDRDFAPVWGMTASLQFLSGTTPLPVHHWLVVIMDTSDQQGALGYHNLTDNNLPVGKIFAKDDQKYGLSWTVTLSHEVIEMLGDPYIANCAFVQDSNTTGVLYAYELCDPCESDDIGYKINGTLVSNFVYPSWFEGFIQPNSTKFDFMGKITRPFQLAPGGYISKFIVGTTGGSGWTQSTAESTPSDRLASKMRRPGTRTSNRANRFKNEKTTSAIKKEPHHSHHHKTKSKL